MSVAASISPHSCFTLILPDCMSCDVPFKGSIKYPFYKDPEHYGQCLNAAFLTANINEDRFCFMLEPGKNKRTLELIVPALPSTTFGFKSPRTKRLLLFSALQLYSKNHYTYANKRYAKEIKLLGQFMSANERSVALNFEAQREVDTILASNISVTEILESLIAEPVIRYLWVRIQGKSGNFYRLRVCDTELALCKEDGSDVAIHVWPWQEVGEPKCVKTEVRMPWLITDERPHLTTVLADVLHSKRPENLNEAKRRRLSRADSIPPPAVFEAKYHHTITVFVKDVNSSCKLAYQITCVRAMAFANDTQPGPEPEEADSIGAEWTRKVGKPKKKGFSLCGLNCVRGKEEEEEAASLESYRSRRSRSNAQARSSVAEVVSAQNLQKGIEISSPPPPPQRRSSSSVSKPVVTEAGDTEAPDCTVQPINEHHTAPTPNGDALLHRKSREPVFNSSFLPPENAKSVHLSRYPTYTKSDSTSLFFNEPQTGFESHPNKVRISESALSSFVASASESSPGPGLDKVDQAALSFTQERNGTYSPGLNLQKDTESLDYVNGRSQPSPKKREKSTTPSSPEKSASLSGIPLPRNPARVMTGGALHPGEIAEKSTEATIVAPSIGSLEFVQSEHNASESIAASPVLKTAVTTTLAPVIAAQIGQNGVSKTDSASPTTTTSSTIRHPTQTQRTSGLTGPKVVVNKPGINMYKGRSTLPHSPLVKAEPEGDPRNMNSTTTSSPSSPTLVVTRPSNIRPPTVTTEASGARHQPRSSIPKRSPSATRNGHESVSTTASQAATPIRSALTGIRVPSRLPRQTLTK